MEKMLTKDYRSLLVCGMMEIISLTLKYLLTRE
nr:MAG TPA: hypothetical protein [Caudoviricetes sp.]